MEEQKLCRLRQAKALQLCLWRNNQPINLLSASPCSHIDTFHSFASTLLITEFYLSFAKENQEAMNSHFFTCSSGLSSTLGMAMVEECEGLYFKEMLPT
jgi:hypothetical protein